MAKYYVDGTITFDVELEVEAENEEQALINARELVNDSYNLDVHGYHHDTTKVKMKFDAAHEDDVDWID